MELGALKGRRDAIGAGSDAALSIKEEIEVLCDRSDAIRSILREAVIGIEGNIADATGGKPALRASETHKDRV